MTLAAEPCSAAFLDSIWNWTCCHAAHNTGQGQDGGQCSGRNIPSGYILLQNGRDAGCAIWLYATPSARTASRSPRAAHCLLAAYRALVHGVWQLDTARRGGGHGAIALRESYIQYVPRDDLNKEERREIKYRDYWFQTRRKVAGHGFSFFLQRLCSSSRIVSFLLD